MSESEDSSSSDVFVTSSTVYTIETVEKITHISRDEIVLYYQSGLVSPIETDEETHLVFDDRAIHQLRRIAFLLSEYRVNHAGLKAFSDLFTEVDRLREELRFLRNK